MKQADGEYRGQARFWREVFHSAWQDSREEVKSHFVGSVLALLASLALGGSAGVAQGGNWSSGLFGAAGVTVLVAVGLYLWKLLWAPGKLYERDLGASLKSPAPIQLSTSCADEFDGVDLIPGYSSDDPAGAPDRTRIIASLTEIDVINHDDRPTEILRLWIAVMDAQGRGEIAPLEIATEIVTGERRLGPRSRQRLELNFDASASEARSP